jgi:hypothetical protein
MSDLRVRLIGNEQDVCGFVRSLESDPQMREVSVSSPVPSPSDRDRLGHVELVEVLISIGGSVAARAVYEAIKGAFDGFRHRRRMRLEEVVDNEVND